MAFLLPRDRHTVDSSCSSKIGEICRLRTARGAYQSTRFFFFPLLQGALFICEEPKRGAADGQQKFGSGFSWDSVVNILRIRSNVLIFLQAGFGCVPWGIITAYLNDYLAQEGGLEVLNATYVIMLFSIGAALGGVFGSVTGQYLQNKNRALLGIFMGATTILSIPPILGLVLIPNGIKYLPIFFALAIVGGFLASPTGANVPAVVVNSNTPETRGSALAIFNMCNDVGKGLGPLIGAALIGGKLLATANELSHH
mmetsp:Transcript_3733/g.16349  ORF Transcript_3733/g.16349 Transcript_3733/m.16349 type:complete len:255 (+) Transcript_3733:567-1331(+)